MFSWSKSEVSFRSFYCRSFILLWIIILEVLLFHIYRELEIAILSPNQSSTLNRLQLIQVVDKSHSPNMLLLIVAISILRFPIAAYGKVSVICSLIELSELTFEKKFEFHHNVESYVSICWISERTQHSMSTSFLQVQEYFENYTSYKDLDRQKGQIYDHVPFLINNITVRDFPAPNKVCQTNKSPSKYCWQPFPSSDLAVLGSRIIIVRWRHASGTHCQADGLQHVRSPSAQLAAESSLQRFVGADCCYWVCAGNISLVNSSLWKSSETSRMAAFQYRQRADAGARISRSATAHHRRHRNDHSKVRVLVRWGWDDQHGMGWLWFYEVRFE